MSKFLRCVLYIGIFQWPQGWFTRLASLCSERNRDRWRQKSHCHLRSFSSIEGFPQDSSASCPRVREEVQVGIRLAFTRCSKWDNLLVRSLSFCMQRTSRCLCCPTHHLAKVYQPLCFPERSSSKIPYLDSCSWGHPWRYRLPNWNCWKAYQVQGWWLQDFEGVFGSKRDCYCWNQVGYFCQGVQDLDQQGCCLRISCRKRLIDLSYKYGCN